MEEEKYQAITTLWTFHYYTLHINYFILLHFIDYYIFTTVLLHDYFLTRFHYYTVSFEKKYYLILLPLLHYSITTKRNYYVLLPLLQLLIPPTWRWWLMLVCTCMEWCILSQNRYVPCYSRELVVPCQRFQRFVWAGISTYQHIPVSWYTFLEILNKKTKLVYTRTYQYRNFLAQYLMVYASII
jgi:hypothetical protein